MLAKLLHAAGLTIGFLPDKLPNIKVELNEVYWSFEDETDVEGVRILLFA